METVAVNMKGAAKSVEREGGRWHMEYGTWKPTCADPENTDPTKDLNSNNHVLLESYTYVFPRHKALVLRDLDLNI